MIEKARDLIEEEISYIEGCPNDCPHIDAHAHKEGLKQAIDEIDRLTKQVKDHKDQSDLIERLRIENKRLREMVVEERVPFYKPEIEGSIERVVEKQEKDRIRLSKELEQALADLER